MALRKINAVWALAVVLVALATADDNCETRYPIGKFPDNYYSSVKMETSLCDFGYGMDSFCGDNVVAMYHLELTKKDGSTSCVHLTND